LTGNEEGEPRISRIALKKNSNAEAQREQSGQRIEILFQKPEFLFCFLLCLLCFRCPSALAFFPSVKSV
jgi:hypothetical protein